jgi:para-aminobenzoate synthetase/4-amino-4-deoxychorismate lyase
VVNPTRDPDAARGVFETLLVVAGEPIEPEAHLRRLERSLEALYEIGLPEGTEERLREAAAGLLLGRVRLTAAPASPATSPQLEVTVAEVDPEIGLSVCEVDPEIVLPEQGIRLRTHPVPGGLGSHKLVDRRGIERPQPGEAGPLIADRGAVLEAGWANVFAVRGGTLWTPPLDGRILPGTTRAALLALAAGAGIASVERPLRPDDLLDAEEVFLTGSVRGIEAALELDGKPLPGCGPISRRLAGALRRRWGLPGASGGLRAPAGAPPPGLPAR